MNQPEYKIHGSTIWIKGNGIFANFHINGNEAKKLVQHASGDEWLEPFHTIGELPTNTEAKLLNELRKEGKL